MKLQEFQNTVDDLIALYKRWELLKWENARLQDALKQIADQNINPWCATVARAALEEKE